MKEAIGVLGFLAIAAIVVALLFLLIRVIARHIAEARKQQAEFDAFLATQGWTIDPTHRHDFEQRFPSFGSFQVGFDRYADNVLEAVWQGNAFTAFNYHYKVETRYYDNEKKEWKTRIDNHSFEAFIMTPGYPLRPLTIGFENVFDRIGEFLGANDIDFESAEFSRKFRVNSPDKRWAYDVVHARAMEFLLANMQASLQMEREGVMIYAGWWPTHLRPSLDVAAGLLNMLPDYVVERQKAETKENPEVS